MISVIILHYKNAYLTQMCIRSILKSKNISSYEIIVYDNGSCDNSALLLKRWNASKSIVRIISSTKNQGFAEGFNQASQYAKGLDILLLSNDVILDRFCLKELLQTSSTYPHAIIQPKIYQWNTKRIIDNVGGSYSFFGYGKGRGRDEIDNNQYDNQIILDYASATVCMFPTSLFKKLKGYDQWFVTHNEDIDICLRAQKKNALSILAIKALCYHMGSATYKKYAISNITLFHIRKNRIRLIVKHEKGIIRIIKIYPILLLMLSLESMYVCTRFRPSTLTYETKSKKVTRKILKKRRK